MLVPIPSRLNTLIPCLAMVERKMLRWRRGERAGRGRSEPPRIPYFYAVG